MITQINPIPGIKWPHALTDDTFTKEQVELINKQFSNWEKKEDPWAREEVLGYSGIYFFPDCSRWQNTVDLLWKLNDHSYKYNKINKDYLVVLELSIMKPNSKYRFHVDAERKQATGVCYWNKGKDGTIIRSGGLDVHVGYKYNRALWFTNVTEDTWLDDAKSKNDPNCPWHHFENNTDEARYTVNINYCPAHLIKSFLIEKQNQFQHFMTKDEVLWRPLVMGGVKIYNRSK